jgi:hypothetical protein
MWLTEDFFLHFVATNLVPRCGESTCYRKSPSGDLGAKRKSRRDAATRIFFRFSFSTNLLPRCGEYLVQKQKEVPFRGFRGKAEIPPRCGYLEIFLHFVATNIMPRCGESISANKRKSPFRGRHSYPAEAPGDLGAKTQDVTKPHTQIRNLLTLRRRQSLRRSQLQFYIFVSTTT